MNDLIPSLILLAALVMPIVIFLWNIEQTNAAKIIHCAMMGGICLFMGLLMSAAVITLTGIESQLLISTLVLTGSLIATGVRLLWIKRYG